MVADEVTWIDLLDPDRAALEAACAGRLYTRAMDALLAPAEHDDEPRPTIESHGEYLFGVFLVPVVDHEGDRVFYQEVDFVMTPTLVVSVRKTPPGDKPFDTTDARAMYEQHGLHSAGMLGYHLVDDIAERYLDLTDEFNAEIDELEDNIENWPNERIRKRLTGLRHDLLHIRRTLGPTRDAVRRVVDDRVQLEGDGGLDRETMLRYADAYDKLLRASEALELSRDLIAGVRDYHQAKVANDQNEVMKKLTVIASVLLLPTFIVGLYGQNFADIPELRWHAGYGFSWFLIIVTTIGQLWWYRRKGWI